MLKVSIFFVNTPQRTKQPNRVAFFVRWGRHPLIESGSARPSGAAESGSHIRPKSVGELAHQRRGRDIFAKGEIPGIAHKKNPIHIPTFVRRGELRSPAGVQRTPLRSKNGFTKNSFNILHSAKNCAIINSERRWGYEKVFTNTNNNFYHFNLLLLFKRTH